MNCAKFYISYPFHFLLYSYGKFICILGMTGDPLASCDMPVKACKNNLQCGSGSLCSDGVCVSKCTSSAGDCLPNEVCKNGVCKRICSNNEQCADNQVCIDRMCINGCLTSDQCPGSQVCSGNCTFSLFVDHN